MENLTSSDQQLKPSNSPKTEADSNFKNHHKKEMQSFIRCKHKSEIYFPQRKINKSIKMLIRDRTNNKGILICTPEDEDTANNKDLRKVSNYFRFCPLLQIIEIKLHLWNSSCCYINYPHINNEAMKHLSEALKSLCLLKSLRLGFHRDHVTDQGIQYLSHALRNLPSLQTFAFEYQDRRKGSKSTNFISDEGLKSLSRGIKSCRLLTTLELSIHEFNMITDQGIEYLSQALKTLVLLKTLKLNVEPIEYSPYWISDKGLKCLGQGLKSLALLENLFLNFASYEKITDEGMKDLSQALESLPCLRDIYLEFLCCPGITDEGLKHLSKALKQLVGLKALELGFYKTCVGDEGLKVLTEALNKVMKSYYSLEDSMEYFEYLECCPYEILKLCFSECSRIGDEGLMSLVDLLKSHPSMGYANLDFSDCKGITNKGAEYLYHSLKSVDSHPYLNLQNVDLGDKLKDLLKEYFGQYTL